ncbi:MAG TPA: tripartite tricarboxylate transporter substrate binding protein [Burkholderiales bacterium]|nr:tripartite tricarboxylate transporter substrate binding protein [Burkholderiales bacterium]
MNRRLFVTALAAALAAPSLALAQAYPSKPITIIVPFPPGGATDIVARLMGQKLSASLKQPVVVDNKAGATGAIGLSHVARSAPDGYTLIVATASSLGTNPAVSNVPFDPIADFTPIGLLAAEPMGLAVHPSVPANNVKELIAYAKANPGKLNMASFGTGSVSHLAGELFSSMAGIKMVHVPYKGAAPATADLIGGQVSIMFNSISVFVAPAKAGKLKLLASAGAERSRGILADLPTIAESGVPGFEASTWHAALGPANLPQDIVTLLSRELGAALKQPDVQEKLASMSLEPQGATPPQLSEQLRKDVAKWKKTVAEAGIKVR